MRHAVSFLCYNRTPEQLELSKLALNSVLAQDIGPMDIYIVNNGSTDETKDWLTRLCPIGSNSIGDHWIYRTHHESNRSPIWVANRESEIIFARHNKVLGVPNDVILPANSYRLMNEWCRGFVTASGTEDRTFTLFDQARAVSENTPMAVMLTRKWAYDAIVAKDGYFFDEGYFNYASDCDLALRMAACGIRGVQLDLQYYHYGSASWRMLPDDEGRKQTDRADVDRAYFEKKWGFGVSSYEYGARAEDVNFKG